MTITYSMFAQTSPERFTVYKVIVNNRNNKLELTPDEIAMAKIIRYIYEKHGGWVKDFTLYNEATGGMGNPGMFANLGGPKEVPSPDYMSIEEATAKHHLFLNGGFYDKDKVPSPEQIMNEFNRLEDRLIKSIKLRKDKRRELLNKIINTWNISIDGVTVHHGIDKFDENSLC